MSRFQWVFVVFVPKDGGIQICLCSCECRCLTGTIDFSYEDQLLLAAQFLPDVCSLGKELNIKFGEALGQIIPYRLQNMEVNSISNEEFEKLCKERNGTRKGGFGSTTKA